MDAEQRATLRALISGYVLAGSEDMEGQVRAHIESLIASTEEAAVREFAAWLEMSMLDISGEPDPRIRYRLPDGRIATGSAVHALKRYQEERGTSPACVHTRESTSRHA